MIRRSLRWSLETGLGLLGVLMLATRSGFKLSGPYWSWRWHTAFGRGVPGKPELTMSMLEYARWVYQMRRLR